MKQLKVKLDKIGLFLKIVIANTLVVALIIIAMSSVMISQLSSMALESEASLGREAAGQLTEFMQAKYNLAYNLSNLMHTNGNIGDYFSAINADENVAYNNYTVRFINNYLLSVMSTDKDVSDYVLVTNQGNVFSVSSSGSVVISPSFDFYSYPGIANLLESSDANYIFYDPSPAYRKNSRVQTVTIAGKIYDPGLFPTKSVVGVYLMNIPVPLFLSSYEGTGYQKGNLLISNRQDEAVYASDEKLLGKSVSDLYATEFRDPLYSVTVENIGVSGLKTASYISTSDLYGEVNALRVQMALLLVASVAAIALFTFVLLRLYNRRISQIAAKMSAVAGGDLSVRLPVCSSDEIGLLCDSFNRMCEHLDEYIKLNYAAETKLKVSEFNALQAQINPHFLYNTIESIRMRALGDKNPELAQMLSLLGNMFRWSMTFTDKLVQLEDETDYISSYLTLQRFRFGESVSMDIAVPDELLGLYVPKLVLQPIVENAIVHGFNSAPQGGSVSVSAILSGRGLEITVSDDGCGMTGERLLELTRFLEGDHEVTSFASIGLKNVNERVKLLFGERYGITIQSEQGEGTSVLVLLPAIESIKVG